MSGAFSGVPNQFANAVTATGLQLDQNNNTFTAYLNDPTNRNNYAAAGGSTNTLNITFTPAVVGGYTAGLSLTWKWNVTNTGAVVVNANALGNIALSNADGSALVAGQGPVGSIGNAVYDGTQAIYLTPPAPASAAAVSAAVTLAPYVSPGRMQNHPGVAKAWAAFNGTATGTIAAFAAYNISSIVKEGTGSYALTITTPFNGFAYSLSGVVSGQPGGARMVNLNETLTSNSSTVHIVTVNDASGSSQGTYVAVVLMGLQ